MPELTQSLLNRRRDAAVDERLRSLAVDTWTVDGLLHTHAEVDMVDERVKHAARDPVPAGTTGTEDTDAVAFGGDRRHGEDRRLARSDAVGAVGSRVEVAHRVVEEEAAFGDEDERAEGGRERRDQRHDVAGGIGGNHLAGTRESRD